MHDGSAWGQAEQSVMSSMDGWVCMKMLRATMTGEKKGNLHNRERAHTRYVVGAGSCQGDFEELWGSLWVFYSCFSCRTVRAAGNWDIMEIPLGQQTAIEVGAG